MTYDEIEEKLLHAFDPEELIELLDVGAEVLLEYHLRTALETRRHIIMEAIEDVY